jgi:hypothetical protein
MSDSKFGMTVTFTADTGESVTMYHEVDSDDPTVIADQLQKSADEFQSRFVPVTAPAEEAGV